MGYFPKKVIEIRKEEEALLRQIRILWLGANAIDGEIITENRIYVNLLLGLDVHDPAEIMVPPKRVVKKPVQVKSQKMEPSHCVLDLILL